MKIDLIIPINVELTDFTNILLKYSLRGISKNMPWLNSVILAVNDNIPLPEWLNQEAVRIVYYKEFIPEEYLPTANLNTVELFEYRIPNLTENFIIADPSFFAIDKLYNTDFFDKTSKLPIMPFIPGHMLGNVAGKPEVEDLITVKQYQKFIDSSALTCIKRARQNFIPCTKNSWIQLFNAFGEELYKSITETPDESNYNKYIICYYGLANNIIKEAPDSLSEGLFKYNTFWAGIIKYDLLNNPDRKIICLDNVNNLIQQTAFNWIVEGLDYRIGSDKSKFEL